MFSKTRFIVMAIATVMGGCGVNNERKDACTAAIDCLDGFTCVNRVCVRPGEGPDAGGPGGGGDGDGPSDGDPDPGNMNPGTGAQFGDVEPLAPLTTGLASPDDIVGTLLGAASTGGNFGCALIGDEASSPGGLATLVQAKIRSDLGGDARCPAGTYAILNDPVYCAGTFVGRGPQCAVYKRWDASGALVAQRLAIGGFVSVEDVARSEAAHTCTVEATLVFSGRSIDLSFSFDFNPFAPDDTFCVH